MYIVSSVTSIGENVFNGCSGLMSITVDGNNTVYASQNGILYNKNKTMFIHIPNAIKGSVTIPDGVTTIGANAFIGCSGLTNIAIGKNVTTIGNYAFSECSSLASVIIPKAVTSIGTFVLKDCSSLENIFYTGTAEEWTEISVLGNLNDDLINATRYYYSEEQPTEAGNYWHYSGGEVVKWTQE